MNDIMKFGTDMVFVGEALIHPCDKPLPYPRFILTELQRVRLAVIMVEISPDAHVGRIGCPEGKIDPSISFMHHRMRTELVVEFGVVPLFEQIDIQFAQS
jgi:hypothetical protein